MLNKQWLARLAGILMLWLAIAGTWLRAAEPLGSFTVKTLGTEEGLPQSSVLSIIQSRSGYLWLGTLKGLVRFDGLKFTTFNEFDTPGLKSDAVIFLFEDSHTNLWVGMDSGDVAMISDGQIKNINLGGAGHDSRLVSACEDTNHTVWLYTADARLARYRNGTLEAYPPIFPGRPALPPPAASRMVVADHDGSIWVGESEPTNNAFLLSFNQNSEPSAIQQEFEAARFDYLLSSKKGGIWRFQEFQKFRGFRGLLEGHVQKWNGRVQQDFIYPWGNPLITAACEDAAGNLIVGTLTNGVYWFDEHGDYRHISRAEGLSSDVVLSLCLDQEGNVWVGTDGDGVNRLKRTPFLSPGSLHALPAKSLSQDTHENLWIAFTAHGITRWQSNSTEDYPIGKYQSASAVLVDHRGTVWAGTSGEGLFSLQNGQFQEDLQSANGDLQVFALFEDRRGTLWAGTQYGVAHEQDDGWKWFTTTNGLPENSIRALADDPAGGLWIGTENNGLSRLKDGQFTNLPAATNGPPGNDISALFMDRDGTLWVGTAGHGLGRLRLGQWTQFSTLDGLAGNSISYITEDEQGDLWIGSNAGLMRVPKPVGDKLAGVRTFGRADGLPSRECSIGAQPATCQGSDGQLWFPTVKGVVSVTPSALKKDLQPPIVMIESVKIDGREQKTNSLSSQWPQSIQVPAGFEQLEIYYTGLHFSAPEELRFRYQLEGHEKQTEAGAVRVARYSHLWPGHYVFHVTAGNEDGVWNEKGSTLAITVLPEFWQTRTFFAVVIILILAMVAGVVRYVSTQKLKREVALFKQHEELEKERSRIARDLHDQLGANLTQVALLGEMAKSDRDLPEEVEAHADQILQTARETTHALDEIVWAVNPSNDTLEGLVNYAVKYAQEYLGIAGLRYRADVPAQVPGVAIPPEVRHHIFLAFKEAVNNVVKHAQASEVWIRLQISADRFTFEIADNGRGLAHLDPARAKTRNGLRNMRKRLEEIHGEFSMTPGPNGGTIVRLTAPLAKSGK